ncbi:MAG: hypothetical protein RMJ48_03985 [Roseiflexaceae bacterium]|nr:hypothetical protein [Roseiflexus sp.]MDW8145452.1 hypothetical protein [Roseiflexaceae bacterium]
MSGFLKAKRSAAMIGRSPLIVTRRTDATPNQIIAMAARLGNAPALFQRLAAAGTGLPAPGIVLAQRCGAASVATMLALLRDQPDQTLRKRLRDWQRAARHTRSAERLTFCALCWQCAVAHAVAPHATQRRALLRLV